MEFNDKAILKEDLFIEKVIDIVFLAIYTLATLIFGLTSCKVLRHNENRTL
jgi:hypothetical protein